MSDEEKKVDVDTQSEEIDNSEKIAEENKQKEEERIKKLEKQKVKEGDMVFVDILGSTVEEDESKNMVFQVSNPEDAKLLPNYDPKKEGQYNPDLAIIGKKGFLDETNQIRYWKIPNLATVPCGGTHVHSTQEVGQIELKRDRANKGVERIRIYLKNN